jgi:arsenite methyltransferase
VELWIGCLAGALEENEYIEKLRLAGFVDVEVEPTRIYLVEDAREFLNAAGFDADALAPMVDGKFMSSFVRARKPEVFKEIGAPTPPDGALRGRPGAIPPAHP